MLDREGTPHQAAFLTHHPKGYINYRCDVSGVMFQVRCFSCDADVTAPVLSNGKQATAQVLWIGVEPKAPLSVLFLRVLGIQ
jgi:hypothetical protein